MSGYFTNAGAFLLDTLFSLYLFAVLLRFLLQAVRADFYNPVAHFIVVITNPPLKPLRRLIPGLYGIDLASIVLLILIEAAYQLLHALLINLPIDAAALTILGFFHLAQAFLNIYFFGILIRVVLSWLNPYPNPLSQMLARITDPLLRPARRLLPPYSGIDFSPMIVMLGLVLVQMALPYLQRGALELLR
ncbi:MAG: YggT family protein [Gammaproteobacteria bacterium]|nr:YggT family protein [Gammaproteobacteria bacterium]